MQQPFMSGQKVHGNPANGCWDFGLDQNGHPTDLILPSPEPYPMATNNNCWEVTGSRVLLETTARFPLGVGSCPPLFDLQSVCYDCVGTDNLVSVGPF